MSKNRGPAGMVGNDFVVAAPRLQLAAPSLSPQPTAIIPVMQPTDAYNVPVRVPSVRTSRFGRLHQALDVLHNYSLGAFALLFLLVGSSAIQLGSIYWTNKIIADAPVIPAVSHNIKPKTGFNMTIPTAQAAQAISAITSQPFEITIASHTEQIDSKTISNWLQVVNDTGTKTTYVHVKDAAIASTLKEITKKYDKSPVNQVSVTRDGITSVIASGRNGLKVADGTGMARDIAKSVLAANGVQMALPSETVPFPAVTPAAFSKMIEVDVVSKQMYLYENGQVVKQYAISAGAPETPTPIGQFKTYSKLTVQDMRGFNPNGTKYFQPHVRWISYFLPGGYAIHGNYWRPQSWFGARNSSHGCVSLPDAQAKEVFDWAPVGTTVITHS